LANFHVSQRRPQQGQRGDPAAEVLRPFPWKVLRRHLYIRTHSSERRLPACDFLPAAVEMHANTVECSCHKMPLRGWQGSGCGQAVFFAHPEDQLAVSKSEVS